METTSRHAEYAQVGPIRRLVRATGAPHRPAWHHNLRPDPRAAVTVDGTRHQVEAHELLGQERDRCFEQAVGMHPGFAIYRTRATNRRIPVMRLDPA